MTPMKTRFSGGSRPTCQKAVIPENRRCTQTRRGMKIPSDVALRGRTSFWGEWKATIEVKIPESARNLLEIGGERRGRILRYAKFPVLTPTPEGIDARNVTEMLASRS